MYTHSPEKLGKDAAEIAGLPDRTGIIATNDIDALLALEPDCVLYMVNGEIRPVETVEERRAADRTIALLQRFPGSVLCTVQMPEGRNDLEQRRLNLVANKYCEVVVVPQVQESLFA